MGKKGRKNQRQEQQHEQQQQQGGGENQNEENKDSGNGTIILGVFIHCEGCGNAVIKSLRGFEGVEGIEIDPKNHKVTVKGKKADPIKVAERLRKKSGKHVELISPKPKKEEKKKEEKKPDQPKVVEVVLKVYIHCEGCAKEVKHCIHNMEGVQTVDPNMEKNLVTVKGTMDPQKLVEFINKRGGRHAEILKQTNINKNKGDQNSENPRKGEKKDQEICYSKYPTDLVYAPQLFSDENPSSCSIM